MSDFLSQSEYEGRVSICFAIEEDEVMAIGQKMEAINEQAYMNGYNWEAFLNRYLEVNYPELLEGMESDPEAGAYFAYYDVKEVSKAHRLQEVIQALIGNPDAVYSFLKENGEEIEWD